MRAYIIYDPGNLKLLGLLHQVDSYAMTQKKSFIYKNASGYFSKPRFMPTFTTFRLKFAFRF